MGNLFADLPDALVEEVIEIVARGSEVRIERITSHGQSSPAGFWYDQAETEWVAVLSGWGTLEWPDGRRLTLRPGDHLLLPAHQQHRVAATDPRGRTVWLAVFWAQPPSS